jgi:MoaA/NifB/PqqE/SkfB family radical SAM enzyme
MGKTLSIETGIRCSNRCSFCYQFHWRSGTNRLPDPTYAALEAKLVWGRDNGYQQVGFSGGEPTVRKDFVELVGRARGLGYTRVGLTTNGRRFADEAYARSLLEAGVDSIGWSLHGADAATHDGLVQRRGAFQEVMAGLANVARLSRTMGLHVDQNLFVLVNRHNHRQLSAICKLGRMHGIKLMILQPVVYSKGNLALAADHSLPLPQLLQAIDRAAASGLKEGWFVKLFNLPSCFFPDALKAFEHQRYPVDVFRYQERKRAGESRKEAGRGYFRLDRCDHCLLDEFCPGLHQSLVGQEELASIFETSLVVPEGGAELWLAGLELFEPTPLEALFRRLRRAYWQRPLRVYYSGDSVAGDGLLSAALRGGVDRISLLYQGMETSQTELSARSGGNASALMSLLTTPTLRSAGPLGISLAVPYVHSATLAQWQEVMRFAAAGCHRLEIQLPWDFKNPEVFEFRKFFQLGRLWRQAGGQDWEVVVPTQELRGTALFRLPTALFGRVSLAQANYASHFFSGPQAGWVAGSLPAFARQGRTAAEPVLAGLPGRAVDAGMLDEMRPG